MNKEKACPKNESLCRVKMTISTFFVNWNKTINNRISSIVDAVESRLNSHFLPLLLIGFVILFAYGYELFNFHLTIDEEIHADYSGSIFEWMKQGRFSLYILSFFLSSTVVPTVSPMLCLFLSSISWWFLLTKLYKISRFASCLSICVALTFPTMAFSITFSTLAYGLGVANVCLLIFAYYLRKGKFSDLGVAAFFGGFAIGIYQTFIFAIAALALFEIITNIREFSRAKICKIVCASVFSVLIYFLADLFLRFCFDVDLKYVGSFVDLGGFFGNPLGRMSESFISLIETLGLATKKFGSNSPWLYIVFCLIFLSSIARSVQLPIRVRMIYLCAIVSIILIPVLADSISANGAPLRSVVYYPLIICVFIALGINIMGDTLKILIILAIIPTVIANSIITNRLFNSSAIAYKFDQNLAYDIFVEFKKNTLGASEFESRTIEIIGDHTWSENKLMPKRETFGASFFEWDSGNRYRIAAFLRLSGLSVIGAEDEERVRIASYANLMPPWPSPGWLKVDGKTIVIKFSDYTPVQRKSLCTAGVSDLCIE